MKEYKTILADPPWNEKGAGKIKRGADKHYNLMKTDEIIQLLKDLEIFNPDPDGCHFYLWTTNNYLPDGLKLIEELGFRYITNLCWYKRENSVSANILGVSTNSVCFRCSRKRVH